MEEKKSSFAVPISIVIAGVLIAGAVYLSNKNRPVGPVATSGEQTTVSKTEIPLNSISQDDHIRGNPNAKVVIVEFSDPECPFCKQFHTTMKSLVDKLGKDSTIAWVYRNFPIKELHSKAPREAEALECAGMLGGNTGFWNYTDKIYQVTPSNNGLEDSQLFTIAGSLGINTSAFKTCLDGGQMTAAVSTDYEDAIRAGGSGTPFSVFVVRDGFDGKKVENFINDSILKYKFPAYLFSISEVNHRVSVSGSMPADFLESLISILTS